MRGIIAGVTGDQEVRRARRGTGDQETRRSGDQEGQEDLEIRLSGLPQSDGAARTNVLPFLCS
jgi:hypothetical protein